MSFFDILFVLALNELAQVSAARDLQPRASAGCAADPLFMSRLAIVRTSRRLAKPPHAPHAAHRRQASPPTPTGHSW